MYGDLNSRVFLVLSYLILAATGVAAVYLMTAGRWLSAAGLGGFIALALIFLAQSHRDKLPAIFDLLFVLAGLINAAAYVFELWRTPVWFDEAVHFYTSFTIMAAIGWLAFRRTRLNTAGRSLRFVVAVTGLGILLGIFWELFEWTIGIIGSTSDTITDLLMDSLGAIVAGLFSAWTAERERRAGAVQASTGGGPGAL